MREELKYLAKDKKEWARRVRELRTEQGWPIVTKKTAVAKIWMSECVCLKRTDKPTSTTEKSRTRCESLCYRGTDSSVSNVDGIDQCFRRKIRERCLNFITKSTTYTREKTLPKTSSRFAMSTMTRSTVVISRNFSQSAVTSFNGSLDPSATNGGDARRSSEKYFGRDCSTPTPV
jgi:hypothetical protein